VPNTNVSALDWLITVSYEKEKVTEESQLIQKSLENLQSVNSDPDSVVRQDARI
jgi:hypothetical protein